MNRRAERREQARALSKRLKDHGAQALHREMAFPPDAKCQICSNRPVARAIVMAPFDEATKRGMVPPNAALNPQWLLKMIVQIKNSSGGSDPYIRISMTYACEHHRKMMERELAKAPSWCIVELNEGPKDIIQA